MKQLICSGNIDAETILGNEIIANDIKCSDVSCTGNIIARTTIDVNGSLKTDNSVMAGEGILGTGCFWAKNAVAVEYFSFPDSEIHGRVLEMDTDEIFGEPFQEEEDIDVLFSKLKVRIADELEREGKIDKEHLVELVGKLSAMDVNSLIDWESITGKLIELSYAEKITNLRDYLILVMAKNSFPEQIIGYEIIGHVFDKMLLEAEKEVDTLPFHAYNINELAYALKIVCICEDEIKIAKDEALDRIFQSIGIKYKTVKAFLG